MTEFHAQPTGQGALPFARRWSHYPPDLEQSPPNWVNGPQSEVRPGEEDGKFDMNYYLHISNSCGAGKFGSVCKGVTVKQGAREACLELNGLTPRWHPHVRIARLKRAHDEGGSINPVSQ